MTAKYLRVYNSFYLVPADELDVATAFVDCCKSAWFVRNPRGPLKDWRSSNIRIMGFKDLRYCYSAHPPQIETELGSCDCQRHGHLITKLVQWWLKRDINKELLTFCPPLARIRVTCCHNRRELEQACKSITFVAPRIPYDYQGELGYARIRQDRRDWPVTVDIAILWRGVDKPVTLFHELSHIFTERAPQELWERYMDLDNDPEVLAEAHAYTLCHEMCQTTTLLRAAERTVAMLYCTHARRHLHRQVSQPTFNFSTNMGMQE